MNYEKREIINALRREIAVIRDGQSPSIFGDPSTCLNAGLDGGSGPCAGCFLLEWVPAEHREKDEPCHHIPLNDRGDTVASLKGADRERLHAAMLTWLHATIGKLEKELSRSRSAA